MNAERVSSASKDMMQAIKKGVILQSLQLENSLPSEGGMQENPSGIIKDYLNAPMGSDKDAKIKKIVSAAVTIAQQNDCLPSGMTLSEPKDVAIVVDDSLNRAKLAYQVGMGIIDPVEVVDGLIDTAAARTVALVDSAFKNGTVNKVLTQTAVGLLTWLKVPNAQSYAPLISTVICRVEKPIQNAITKGINFIAQTAKKTVRKVATTIKEFVKSKILAIS